MEILYFFAYFLKIYKKYTKNNLEVNMPQKWSFLKNVKGQFTYLKNGIFWTCFVGNDDTQKGLFLATL